MREEALRFLRERYGIGPEAFSGLDFYATKKYLWVCTPEAASWRGPGAARRGIRLLRRVKGGFKLTSFGAQIVGHLATRNVVEVSREEAVRYLRGEDVAGSFDAEDGVVIIRCQGRVIGVGLLRNGRIKNQVPGGHRLRGRVL